MFARRHWSAIFCSQRPSIELIYGTNFGVSPFCARCFDCSRPAVQSFKSKRLLLVGVVSGRAAKIDKQKLGRESISSQGEDGDSAAGTPLEQTRVLFLAQQTPLAYFAPPYHSAHCALRHLPIAIQTDSSRSSPHRRRHPRHRAALLPARPRSREPPHTGLPQWCTPCAQHSWKSWRSAPDAT